MRKITACKRNKLTSRLLMAGIMLWPFSSLAIELKGLEDYPDLTAYMNERVISPLEQEDKIYPSAVKAQLQKALKAQGHYNGRVQQSAEEENTYKVIPGPQTTISSYDIQGYTSPPSLQLMSGDPLIAAVVLSEQQKLLEKVSEDNCFYKLSIGHSIYLNRASHSADINFEIDASENAVFGTTEFTGSDNIDDEYLHKFITYKDGDCWKTVELEETKNALIQTGLISTIDVRIPEDVPADGRVPVTMELKEREPRKVRIGANYNTSEGPGISAEWLHRNFFGSGEELSVSSRISKVLQRLGFNFKKPFFLTDKQDLNISSELRREDTDAYEEFGLNASAIIDRKLSRFWSGGVGVALDLLQVREEGEQTENFALVSFPARMNYDSRDDVLDPHDGYTLRLMAAPFIDALGTSSPFLKTRVTGTAYIGLGEALADAVIALRASVGSIFGTETQDIPASFRFYAGGGGSIRGYGYQEAGPVDAQNDPAGGRSLLETSVEARWKFSEKYGAAAFVDAGGVYDSAFPDLEGGAYIGAGVGVRYYTDFGPIRFDVAVPLNKKERLGQNYQFYISIGQAF